MNEKSVLNLPKVPLPPPVKTRALSTTTPIRRKPAPTPEITIAHEGFNTPESVRIRRLRFEIELQHGNLSGGSPRRRGMSYDGSPRKVVLQSIGHLSTSMLYLSLRIVWLNGNRTSLFTTSFISFTNPTTTSTYYTTSPSCS